MEQAIIDSFYFYIAGVGAGTILGIFSTIIYSGLYFLRNN